MHAKQIEVELITDNAIEDNVMLKGEIRIGNTTHKKIVAWLKPSKYEPAIYFFFINEDVEKGQEPIGFTEKPISIRTGQYGLYANGPIMQIGDLKFPISGNVDFESERKSITLKLANEKSIEYFKGKGYEYNLGTEEVEVESNVEEDCPF